MRVIIYFVFTEEFSAVQLLRRTRELLKRVYTAAPSREAAADIGTARGAHYIR